jgi:hypothetical protein
MSFLNKNVFPLRYDAETKTLFSADSTALFTLATCEGECIDEIFAALNKTYGHSIQPKAVPEMLRALREVRDFFLREAQYAVMKGNGYAEMMQSQANELTAVIDAATISERKNTSEDENK